MNLFDLSTEITAISMIVAGLGNQLDNTETDTLTPDAMRNALYGIQSYLQRIANDLSTIDAKRIAAKSDAA